MPPDSGRASRACTACRKQKTRCYASANSTGTCLRCERLRQSCSLDSSRAPSSHGSGTNADYESASYEERIKRLERTVQKMEERLDMVAPRVASLIATSSQSSPANRDHLGRQVPAVSSKELKLGSVRMPDTPSTTRAAAPVFAIRDVAREVGAVQNDYQITHILENGISSDIIDTGLVGLQDASFLLALFLEHYGRWVAFRETSSPDLLLAEVRKSPLLLCACCLIAVRHTTQEQALILAPQLFNEAKSLLSAALLVVPQSIAFFQATLILSLWSTTIGQALLSIDSWLLSGFALQHTFSSELFASVTTTSHLSSLSRQEIDRWFIWNHLCLVHLHYCVGTRRKAQLDSEQIEKCSQILGSDNITNFETRMVAEINLYWIIYESTSHRTVDIPGTQALLEAWKQKWKFLFDQTRAQFVQMGFYFAQLLIYEQALKSRSARVRESLLSEMVRLSAAILTLAMDTADLRTQHLSDHIYHIITFAAVTLCRLLHMYEDQLSRSYDIPELDQLVLTLVTWLHSIGLPCHISHTLSDVVSAFHEKLRPHTRPPPSPYTGTGPWMQDDIAFVFPDLLGTDLELFYSGNGNIFPDWDAFIPGPPS